MAQSYLEHIKTYTIPIVNGKGELNKIALPLKKQFLDRIVLFSNNITESEINQFWVKFVHGGSELFGEKTSARFFSANDGIAPKEKGFHFPFDVKSANTYLDISFSSEDTSVVQGTIYVTIFYRDKPLSQPIIEMGEEHS